jgi:predicted nucleotidyltransferase
MDVVRVIVFGSAASGNVDCHSDLDLAIVVADPEDPAEFNRTERALEVRRRIRDINAELALDILVYSESEFERLSRIPSTVRNELIEGGETVYERAR